MDTNQEISISEYQALAEFRYQLRRFLHFSEEAARSVGLEPQQHQLLLALKGLPEGRAASVGELSEHLQIPNGTLLRAARMRPELQQVAFGYNPFQLIVAHDRHSGLPGTEKCIGFMRQGIALQFSERWALQVSHHHRCQWLATGKMAQ